jgi:alcohol dehydrogenase class IV
VARLYRALDFPSDFPPEVGDDTISDLARRAHENPLMRYNIRRASRADLETVYRRARRGWAATWPE